MSQVNPLISFILPNYNNQHVLDLFFEKFIENNTYDNYEFIVTDDGSEDDGLELLYKWQQTGKIKNMYVIAEPHKGIINALNTSLFKARGEFIIRLDGDATIETKGFVEKFLEFYNIAPSKIGVITSKVIVDNGDLHAIGRNIITPSGLGDRGKEPSEPIGKRTWDEKLQVKENLHEFIDTPAEVDTALGVCTFCDRKTAMLIGGFDKNYPLWIEDDDFYLSFRLHGKKIFYLPCVEICHRFSLRGNRDPSSWKNKKNKKTLFSKLLKIFWNKKVKSKKTIYKILGLNVFKIKEKSGFKIYSLLGLPILKKEYLGWRPSILLHNYKYWEDKWGFNILNPDLEAIKNKYHNTEILWNYDEQLKQAGQDILDRYVEISERTQHDK